MRTKPLFVGAALILPLLAAGTVFAGRGYFRDPERIKDRVFEHLEEALEDTAPLSKQQEQAVSALFDRSFEAVHQGRDQRWAMADKALGIFAAERIDEGAVTQLREAHRAEMQQMEERITGALRELHDILTPKQRQAVAAYARDMKGRHGSCH